MQLRHILNYKVYALFLALSAAGSGGLMAGEIDANRIDRAPSSSSAQASDHPTDDQAVPIADRYGVLVMAHGGNAAWNRAVESTVALLREAYPIEIAFGMARTSTMRDAVERLELQGVNQIAVVRMFISGESFLENTKYILGLRSSLDGEGEGEADAPMHGATGQMNHPMSDGQPTSSAHAMEAPRRINSNATFVLSKEGVAASPLVDDILLDRVQALSTDPSQEYIVILAHGPGNDDENEQWLANMRRRAERIGTLGQFRDVWCETLREDWPERRAAAEERIREYVRTRHAEGFRVIVAPFRVAGFGPYAKILEGLDYIRDGRGFCPHPNMTRWIDQTARKSMPSLPTADLDQRIVRAD